MSWPLARLYAPLDHAKARAVDVFVQIGFEIVMARHRVLLAALLPGSLQQCPLFLRPLWVISS